MSKAIGTVISPNTFRAALGMDPVLPAKHKLVIWPNWVGESQVMTTLKCVKCTRGKLSLPTEVIRGIVSGTYCQDFFMGVAWGSWGLCREDLDEPLRPPTTPN